MAPQLLDDLFVKITGFDQLQNFLLSLVDPGHVSMGSSHRPALPATIRVWAAGRVARKPVHANTAVKTKRMLQLRIRRTAFHR